MAHMLLQGRFYLVAPSTKWVRCERFLNLLSILMMNNIDDQMEELFQQLLEDGFTVEQAADLAYNEIFG